MTDWRGTPIHVGSTVVYPSRHSSSVWMTEATVIGLHINEGRLHKLTIKRTRTTRGGDIVKPIVTLHNLSDVLVIAPPKRSQAARDWNAVRSGMHV